jgi:hypothetical protein
VGLLDAATRPLRALLGSAEHEVEETLPVHEIEDIQKQILEGVGAMRRATESIDSHVAAVDALANSMPTLTAAVEALTAQLALLSEVVAPVSAAEREVADVEHRLARLGGLFGHQPHGSEPEPPPTQKT